MHDTSTLIEARIARTYADRILPARYRTMVPIAVERWEVPDEPVPFTAVAEGTFSSLRPGQPWGKPWGTTWLRITATAPTDWPADAEIELVVDLGFLPSQPGFQAEGLVWTEDGRILKALEPRNTYVPLDAGPGDTVSLLIEAASNPDVGADWSYRSTPLGDKSAAGTDPIYRFAGAWLGVLDREAFDLERDWVTLEGLLHELPAASPRRAGILRALDRACDALDFDDIPGSVGLARTALAPALAARASASSHRIVATGHAHIDSAWLWPVRETIRKCARTFSNVLDLMNRYPQFVFAASSAQQYAWMRDFYPQIFEGIKRRTAEGRWVPVGGMWVESDTNLPGGEALARQFVAGKGFFIREFGVETSEVWLPDSFGYSGALPQIIAAANSHHFLTQKTSWNETNRMPHNSFLWEGIDGTRVFTHFPPVDTYNSDLGATDLARAERQHAERGISDLSLVPFGYGNGGGGPTREMLEEGLRKHDLDGSPQVKFGRPDDFFMSARSELPQPAVWSGEMYLEFHRGTYTSQARTKRGNRRSEHLLREAELWATTATVRLGVAYPADELRLVWETVLLQQFHDILPGSSIAWVHQEAERNYAEVSATLETLIASAISALSADGGGPVDRVAFNASPFPVGDVAPLGAAPATPASGKLVATDSGWNFETDAFLARIDADGLLCSLLDRTTGRDVVPAGDPGNRLELFRDAPSQWDAWDVDQAYQQTPLDRVGAAEVEIAKGINGAPDELEVRRTVGTSTVLQRIRFAVGGALEIETRVDWQERQKLLKLAFPFDVHSDRSASEVQFGYVRRATHTNTSWDRARFEISGHRWVHVDEPGLGITIANDRVYGRDVTRSTRIDGGTTTLVRESLLRASTYPDPTADHGAHVFRHSIVVGELLDGIAEGYRINLPLRHVRGRAVTPLISIDNPALVVEAVKLAEDGSGDVVVRLYEARGGRAFGRLTPNFGVAAATRTDLLERTLDSQPEDALELDLRPFQIVTVRLARA